MKRLAGKVAIITGGARGMGAATTRLFAAEGARIVIADVLDAEGDALAREIGPTALFQHHDVADEESWQRLVRETVTHFGGVDVLVNNAGILLMKGLLDIEKQEFERVLAVNLVGTFLGIRTTAPKIIERGGGLEHHRDEHLPVGKRATLRGGAGHVVVGARAVPGIAPQPQRCIA